jgi:hypothetical protein
MRYSYAATANSRISRADGTSGEGESTKDFEIGMDGAASRISFSVIKASETLCVSLGNWIPEYLKRESAMIFHAILLNPEFVSIAFQATSIAVKNETSALAKKPKDTCWAPSFR